MWTAMDKGILSFAGFSPVNFWFDAMSLLLTKGTALLYSIRVTKINRDFWRNDHE